MDNQSNKNDSLSLIALYGGSESESDWEDISNNTGNDDEGPLSAMVLKNNIINACAHGPLPRAQVEEESEIDGDLLMGAHIEDVAYVMGEYRGVDSDSETTSSSDSDSDVDSVKDIEEISSGDETGTSKAAKPEPPKVSGELGLEDLPPIEDLAISLPAKDTHKIGTVFSIVEQLVIVKAYPGTPAVDLDSVLFLEDGAKALGKVFDVFGPVSEPHYAVRFNSAKHAESRGVRVGMDVSIAPHTPHTTYVFLPDLIKMKGSDASWKNDTEPPASLIEYSDDEEERRAKREARQKHADTDDGENSKTRKVTEKRSTNNRPSDSSSRFGSGPSRGRSPFTAGSRRNNPNAFPRFTRPLLMDIRTPPQHPDFGAPPNFPQMFPPPFNQNAPPPFMMQYRMRGPVPPAMLGPHFNLNPPFCGLPSHPQWASTEPPPPPGT